MDLRPCAGAGFHADASDTEPVHRNDPEHPISKGDLFAHLRDMAQAGEQEPGERLHVGRLRQIPA